MCWIWIGVFCKFDNIQNLIIIDKIRYDIIKKNHHIANTKNSVVRSILSKISSDIELLTPDIEKNILKHFKNKCAYTGNKLKPGKIHFDHLIPCNKKYGGLYLPGNLVPTSSEINLKKRGGGRF